MRVMWGLLPDSSLGRLRRLGVSRSAGRDVGLDHGVRRGGCRELVPEDTAGERNESLRRKRDARWRLRSITVTPKVHRSHAIARPGQRLIWTHSRENKTLPVVERDAHNH
jgi:hypothetical protein